MKRQLLFYCMLIVASLFGIKQVDAQSLTKGYYFIKSTYKYAPANACVYDPETTDYAKIHVCQNAKADIFYLDETESGHYTLKNALTGRYIIKFVSTNSVLMSKTLEDGVYIIIDKTDDGVYHWKDNTQTCYYNWNGDGVNGGAPFHSTYNYHDWNFEAVPADVLKDLGLSGGDTPVDPPVDPDPNYKEDPVPSVPNQVLPAGYYRFYSAYVSPYTQKDAVITDNGTEDVLRVHTADNSKNDIFFVYPKADGQYVMKNVATGRYVIKYESKNSIKLNKALEEGTCLEFTLLDSYNYRFKDNHTTNYYNWNGTNVDNLELSDVYNYHDWNIRPVSKADLAAIGIKIDTLPVLPSPYTEDKVPSVPNQIVPAGYYHVYSAYNSSYRQEDAILYDTGSDDALKVHSANGSKNDVFFIYPKADGQYVMKNLATGRYVIKYEAKNVIKLSKTLEEGTYIEFKLLDDYNFRFKDNHTNNYYNWNGTNVDNLELSTVYNYHDWDLEPVSKAEMAEFGITIDTLPVLPAAPVVDKEIVKDGFYYIRSAYNSKYVGSNEVVYDSSDENCVKIHNNGNEKKDIFLIKQIGTKQYSVQNLGTARYIIKFQGSDGVILANEPEEGTYIIFDWLKGNIYRWKDNHQSTYYNWNGSSLNCGAPLNSTYNYHDFELVPVDKGLLESLGITGDSIPDNIDIPKDTVAYIDASWESLGTSITWYNNNVSSAFTKGYQTRVREVLPFKGFINKGVNAGCIGGCPGQVTFANYYTIEHGINDWGHSTPVGTMEDYINNTKNGSFAATYRELLDKIYATNPNAMVVLCTPRKGYGFGGYLPDNCDDAKNGIYLKDYAEIIRQIAEYESLPVADFFALCGNQRNLAELSIDKALHPNDNGYQLMADVLVKALRKVLIHKVINPVAEDDF